jgi:hypothetical protein
MMYWLTGTAGSSARLYYEAVRSGGWLSPAPSATPTGVAVFPRDIAAPVRRFAELSDKIVHWSEFDRGGHFAAMEAPDLLPGRCHRTEAVMSLTGLAGKVALVTGAASGIGSTCSTSTRAPSSSSMAGRPRTARTSS